MAPFAFRRSAQYLRIRTDTARRSGYQNNASVFHLLHHIMRPQPAQFGIGIGFYLQRRMANAEVFAQGRRQIMQSGIVGIIYTDQMCGQRGLRATAPT